MIDKVYYINLDREIGRHYAQRVTAAMAYLPLEKLCRFPAKDGRGYESNEDILEDIIADGFPEYRWFLEPENKEHIWQDPKNLAVSWSHLSVLREVVNNKENAIILEDDVFIDCLYNDIEKDFRTLDQPFEIVWLSSWRWHEADSEIWNVGLEMEKELELERGFLSTNVEGLYSNYHGLGARSRFFTVAGAKRFFDLAVSQPWYGNELVGWYYSLQNKDRAQWLAYRPYRCYRYRAFTDELLKDIFDVKSECG